MIEIPEDKREEVRQSIPLLKELIKAIEGNDFLKELKGDAERNLEKAEKMVEFDIWKEQDYLEYGCGIHTMVQIHDERYDSSNPEKLLKITFPTGAFIFGERYDIEYFEKFYKELHEVEPDYEYPAGHELYYKASKARKAWDHYQNTLKKYEEGNKGRVREWEIEQTELKLKKLRGEQQNG